MLNVFLADPVRRTEELPRKDVCLDLLPLVGRIPLHFSDPEVDRVATKGCTSDSHLIHWVFVQLEMPQLVTDDDYFVALVTLPCDVDEQRFAVEKAEDARVYNAARLVAANLQVFEFQGCHDQGQRATIATRLGQGRPMAFTSFSSDVDPRVHTGIIPRQIAKTRFARASFRLSVSLLRTNED